VIRVRYVSLPPGLSALVRKGPAGEVEIFVSAALPPERQRAAVRVALRATRRWAIRGVLVPVPLAGLLAASQNWLRGLARMVRAHTLATAASVTMAAVSASVLIVTLPPHGDPPARHRPVVAGKLQVPGQVPARGPLLAHRGRTGRTKVTATAAHQPASQSPDPVTSLAPSGSRSPGTAPADPKSLDSCQPSRVLPMPPSRVRHSHLRLSRRRGPPRSAVRLCRRQHQARRHRPRHARGPTAQVRPAVVSAPYPHRLGPAASCARAQSGRGRRPAAIRGC
jgi:hypothetical protein